MGSYIGWIWFDWFVEIFVKFGKIFNYIEGFLVIYIVDMWN